MSDRRDRPLEIGLVTNALHAGVPPDEPALETAVSAPLSFAALGARLHLRLPAKARGAFEP